MKGGVVGPHTRVMAHTGPQSFPRTPCWKHQGPSGRTSRHTSVCAGTPTPGARRLPTGEHGDPNTWGTATASEVGHGPEGRRLTPHWLCRSPASLLPSQVLFQQASAPTGAPARTHQSRAGACKGGPRAPREDRGAGRHSPLRAGPSSLPSCRRASAGSPWPGDAHGYAGRAGRRAGQHAPVVSSPATDTGNQEAIEDVRSLPGSWAPCLPPASLRPPAAASSPGCPKGTRHDTHVPGHGTGQGGPAGGSLYAKGPLPHGLCSLTQGLPGTQNHLASVFRMQALGPPPQPMRSEFPGGSPVIC